jgi:hypothetical protein
MVMVDAQGIVEVCNRRALELLGVSEALMASRPALDEVRALHWIRFAEAVQRVELGGGAVLYSFSEAVVR